MKMNPVPEKVSSYLEPVCTGLDFPTSLAFMPDGTGVAAESGLPFGGAPPGGRIWAFNHGSRRELIAEKLPSPVNGLTIVDDHIVASVPGALLEVRLDGTVSSVLEGLPT